MDEKLRAAANEFLRELLTFKPGNPPGRLLDKKLAVADAFLELAGFPTTIDQIPDWQARQLEGGK